MFANVHSQITGSIKTAERFGTCVHKCIDRQAGNCFPRLKFVYFRLQNNEHPGKCLSICFRHFTFVSLCLMSILLSIVVA
jgi:hypothetical protein